MSSDTFKWQDRGTAWKGIGIYHVTLTIPNREPLLGELIIPDNDPSKAEVKRTQLGEDLVDCLMHYSSVSCPTTYMLFGMFVKRCRAVL